MLSAYAMVCENVCESPLVAVVCLVSFWYWTHAQYKCFQHKCLCLLLVPERQRQCIRQIGPEFSDCMASLLQAMIISAHQAHTHRHRHTDTDRQTDRQTDRHTHTHTNTHKHTTSEREQEKERDPWTLETLCRHSSKLQELASERN